jgi:hypothetical protein
MKENKFKVYKWKLIHYILPCKELLFKWHITTNNLRYVIIVKLQKIMHTSLNAKNWKHFGGCQTFLNLRIKFNIYFFQPNTESQGN